jgi:hypothetical protein
MRVRFFGTRGSIATPGPHTLRYGGNTSCIEVQSNAGTLVILDMGTGAAVLGRVRRDNQDGKAATIRMRIRCRGDSEGRACVPGMGTGLEVKVLRGARW